MKTHRAYSESKYKQCKLTDLILTVSHLCFRKCPTENEILLLSLLCYHQNVFHIK